MDSNNCWDKKHLLKISNNKFEKSLSSYQTFNQFTAKKSPLVDVSSAVCFREEGKPLHIKWKRNKPGNLRHVLLRNTMKCAVDSHHKRQDHILYRIPQYKPQEKHNPIWDSSKKENNAFIIRLSDSDDSEDDEEKDNSPAKKRRRVSEEKSQPTWDSSKTNNSPFVISLEDSDDSDEEEKNNSPEEKKETVREEKSQPTWDSSKTNNSPFVISLEDSDDEESDED